MIGKSFHETSPAQLSWYMASYSLTAGTFILVMGRLGDIYGHRKLFAAGYAWLALWSLIAGLTVFTGSQVFFDVCRGLQGIGTSILVPNGIALLGLLYPPGPRKAVVFCLFAASAPTGAVAGALFSSIFAQLVWWPWSFFVLAILATSMVVAVFAFVPPPATNHAITKEGGQVAHGGKAKFDWVGAIAGVAGLILFSVAWNQAPAAGWSSPYVLACLILGVLSLIAFVVTERHVDQPIVPTKQLSTQVVLVLLTVMCGWAGFGVWILYWFQFVEVIQGRTPLAAVAQLSAAMPTCYAAVVVTFFLAMRVKSCWIILAAAVAFCAGSIITALTKPETLFWKQSIWALVIIPFGMDMSFPAATLMLSNIVPREHQGIGASLVATTVHYSIALGVGIASNVEVHYDRGGADPLAGYRAAQWTGVGITGLGVLIALYLVATNIFFQPALKNRDTGTDEVEHTA